MRTLIDAICPGCGDVHQDVWIDTGATHARPRCRRCGRELERLWRRTQAPSVHPDSIPGGYWVEHGLCHPDGSPRRYDSRSEMAREARRRGLSPSVRHIGEQGTDKSPRTQRWV